MPINETKCLDYNSSKNIGIVPYIGVNSTPSKH